MGLENLLLQINICFKKKKVILLQKKTKIILKVLDALWDEKLIYGYSLLKGDFINIFLKYNNLGKSFIKKINLISTGGRSLFISIKDIQNLNTNLNTLLFLSTSKGIISHKKASTLNVGGKILFIIHF